MDVGAIHVALISAVARGDAPHGDVGIDPKIDDQLRARNALCQGLVQAVVGLQLIAREIEAGKEGILLKGVVGNQVALGQCLRNGLVLLMIAAEEEEDLRLERVAFPIGVEVGEEWVLLEDLEQQL